MNVKKHNGNIIFMHEAGAFVVDPVHPCRIEFEMLADHIEKLEAKKDDLQYIAVELANIINNWPREDKNFHDEFEWAKMRLESLGYIK